jgi:acyl carrier protein
MSDTFEFIKTSLTSIKDFDVEITPDTYLNSLDLDSLDFVFMQVEIKKVLDVDVDYADFEDQKVPTFAAFAEYVDARRKVD